jgi:hypothetical protein
VSISVVGELVALLRKDKDAVAVPEACGRKVTVNGSDWPAGTVTGKEIPLTTNSALLLLADETVTGELVAVSVPANAVPDPVATFPKFSVPGATVNCPADAPLPDTAMFNCGLDALEVIANCPETAPEAVGRKTTLKVRL